MPTRLPDEVTREIPLTPRRRARLARSWPRVYRVVLEETGEPLQEFREADFAKARLTPRWPPRAVQ